MAIKLDKAKLDIALDRAHAIARSKRKLPTDWLHRVERIEQSPSKTYVAALGAALLAKATDARVNSLARTTKAGPTGYALRTVGEFMASQAPRYGYHLGAPGAWPLNNSPFFRNADRIDRFTNIRGDAKPYHDDFVRYLQDLNRLDEEQALVALAAFLRRRMAYADALKKEVASVATVKAGAYPEVVEIATLFCTEQPEGGKRGQALVAALLDCAYDEVDLKSINNPRPLDVRVIKRKRIILGAEVKQAPVGADTGLHLAVESQALGCDKALLVAIAVNQEPIDREGLRHQALEQHGVLVQVVETVPELFATVTLLAPLSASELARRLPAAYATRLQEHEASGAGRKRWAALVAGLS